MDESKTGARSGLHPDTLRRLREVFEGQICCRCGAAAVRLFGGRFYCVRHRVKDTTAPNLPRVYRCPVWRRV